MGTPVAPLAVSVPTEIASVSTWVKVVPIQLVRQHRDETRNKKLVARCLGLSLVGGHSSFGDGPKDRWVSEAMVRESTDSHELNHCRR